MVWGFANVVNPTLCLVLARPTARAWVVRIDRSHRAGPAANRRIALVPKRVVGQVVLGHVGVDLLRRPCSKRSDLRDTRGKELHKRRVGARRRIAAADAGDPAAQARQRALHCLNFVLLAAVVRMADR